MTPASGITPFLVNWYNFTRKINDQGKSDQEFSQCIIMYADAFWDPENICMFLRRSLTQDKYMNFFCRYRLGGLPPPPPPPPMPKSWLRYWFRYTLNQNRRGFVDMNFDILTLAFKTEGSGVAHWQWFSVLFKNVFLTTARSWGFNQLVVFIKVNINVNLLP